MKYKNILGVLTGIIGAAVTRLFGGWSSTMTTLLILMALDYVTGLIIAGVFKKSKKSKTGRLSSNECWKGLCKKGVSLCFVLIGYRIDLMLGTNYVRDFVVISFIVVELISLVENAGIMGIPIPKVIINVIDILNKKIGDDNRHEQA